MVTFPKIRGYIRSLISGLSDFINGKTNRIGSGSRRVYSNGLFSSSQHVS